MKVTESINYRSDPMPCSRAIKPYLIYELNQVKKQHKKTPSRSAIQFNPASPKRSKFDQMDKASRYILFPYNVFYDIINFYSYKNINLGIKIVIDIVGEVIP